MSATPAISALVAAIPDEEDATFLAKTGDRGRITSRGGSVEVGHETLTVAAIDSLNASIFPPDRLRTLQQTGGVQFYFALPGVQGWFSAMAGSHGDDRWLEIRRRQNAGASRVQPAAEVAALPQATQPASVQTVTSGFDGNDDLADLASLEFPSKPQASQAAAATPATSGLDNNDDLADLANLDFPPRDADTDSDALLFSEELFGMPVGEKPLVGGFVESKDRSRAVVYPQRRRRRRRIGIPVVACAAIVLLGMSYFGGSETAPSAVAIVPPKSVPPPRPSVRPTTPPPPTTASSPVQTTPSNAPAETVGPAEPRRSGFSVQIAAVETQDEADRMMTRFVTRGYSAYVARGAANYFRVRIGAFPDRKTAEDVARRLDGIEGIKPWIAKETPDDTTPATPVARKEESSSRR